MPCFLVVIFVDMCLWCQVMPTHYLIMITNHHHDLSLLHHVQVLRGGTPHHGVHGLVLTLYELPCRCGHALLPHASHHVSADPQLWGGLLSGNNINRYHHHNNDISELGLIPLRRHEVCQHGLVLKPRNWPKIRLRVLWVDIWGKYIF